MEIQGEKALQSLATQTVVHGPTALALPGSKLEMQISGLTLEPAL